MFLHILAKVPRPTVAIAKNCDFAANFVLLHCLAKWIQPEFVFVRLSGWIVSGWHVLKINVLEEIVKQFAHMRCDRLLVKLRNPDAIGVDWSLGLPDHLLEHI